MKTTIAIITAVQTTATIQKISKKSQSIWGPKVEMSCGKYRCSSIDASPLRYQCANSRRAFAAPIKAANATFQRLPIHELDVIMPVSATISEMKNLYPPPQRPPNSRHDAHISVVISSVSWSHDPIGCGSGNQVLAPDWRQQAFGLQRLVEEEEVFVSYARSRGDHFPSLRGAGAEVRCARILKGQARQSLDGPLVDRNLRRRRKASRRAAQLGLAPRRSDRNPLRELPRMDRRRSGGAGARRDRRAAVHHQRAGGRSEEHTSELQSL